MFTVLAVLCALLAVNTLPNDQKLMTATGNDDITLVMWASCTHDEFKFTFRPMMNLTTYKMNFDYHNDKTAYVSDSSAHGCSIEYATSGLGVSCDNLSVNCSKITDPSHKEICQSITETDQGYSIFCNGLFYDNLPKECAFSSKKYMAKLLCYANLFDI